MVSLLKPGDQRQDRALDIGLGQRADMLVADAAALIDDEGFRYAIDAPIDADPPVIAKIAAGIRKPKLRRFIRRPGPAPRRPPAYAAPERRRGGAGRSAR